MQEDFGADGCGPKRGTGEQASHVSGTCRNFAELGGLSKCWNPSYFADGGPSSKLACCIAMRSSGAGNRREARRDRGATTNPIFDAASIVTYTSVTRGIRRDNRTAERRSKEPKRLMKLRC